MEKKKKLIIMLSIALIMQIIIPLITILPETKLTVFSDATQPIPTTFDVSGSGSVTATYNASTKTITISGNGDMKDFDTDSNANPYIYYYQMAENIVVEEGVTGVGDFAFINFSKVTSVKLSNSLKRIGTSAFNGCSGIANIDLPIRINKYRRWSFLWM